MALLPQHLLPPQNLLLPHRRVARFPDLLHQQLFHPVLGAVSDSFDLGNLHVAEGGAEGTYDGLDLGASGESVEDGVGPGRAVDEFGRAEVAVVEIQRPQMKVLAVLGQVLGRQGFESIGDDKAVLALTLALRLEVGVDGALVPE